MRCLACVLALAATLARPDPATAEPFLDVARFFLTGRPWLGLAVERIHLEVFAETGETRRLAGVRGDNAVAPCGQTGPPGKRKGLTPFGKA